VNIIVQQKKDYEDAWELEYEGIGKFNPFDLEWDEDLAPSLSIEFEDSGLHNKFLTRCTIDINVGDTLSIEGVDMGPIPTESIQVHQRRIEETNTFARYENYVYYAGAFVPTPPPDAVLSDDGHIIPLSKISGDTEFVKQPDEYLITPPSESSLMVGFTIVPVALTLKYHIVGSGNTRFSDSTWLRFVVRKFNDKDDLTDITDTLLHEVTITPNVFGVESWGFNFEGTLAVSLAAGQGMTMLGHFELISGAGPHYDTAYSTCDVTVSLVQNYDEYVSECHYRYEFFKRLCQLMTDQVDCFHSKTFGRIDIGYSADGIWHNNVLFSGKQLRGFTTDRPHTTFDKSFKSARSIWNVGIGIEKFGSKFKVVVEDLTYFFRGTISVTLHNVRKVKREINDNFTFSEVKVGYEKSEYEEVNGLEEYNNKSTFASFIKSDTNILDLISPERADGYGMEFARRKNVRIAGTEDTQYDNEIFTAMVYNDEGMLRTQRDENYDSVENIASPETAMNLDITPQRNLYRNGDWVKGCVLKYPNEKLKFVSADKPTDLVSQRTGNTEVSEQTDIVNGTLKSSLWKNENYIFEADIDPAQVATIERLPYSLIKFSPFSREQTKRYWYGWIIEINVGGKERSGNFILLAANIASDRLKIIDPDGIYDRDPETPLPPTDEQFGFQYAFEKVFEV
jgi:hypothetical protein